MLNSLRADPTKYKFNATATRQERQKSSLKSLFIFLPDHFLAIQNIAGGDLHAWRGSGFGDPDGVARTDSLPI